MAPKRPVPLGWGLRENEAWGTLYYINMITGDLQLQKPSQEASLATDEEFSLSDEIPLKKKKPKRVAVRHILVKHYLSDHTIMCRVLSGEYATRSKKQAYEVAEAIREEIILGKIAFQDAALEHSECSSAFRGGLLDPIFKGDNLNKPFKEAAFNLEINEISHPVETTTGFHIIQRIA